jgi:hypothetical protein
LIQYGYIKNTRLKIGVNLLGIGWVLMKLNTIVDGRFMRNEHFRGVLWPRQLPSEGPKENYRYVICGVLVTDKPLNLPEEFANESIIDGFAAIADGIEAVNKRAPKIPTGDALSVLHSLDVL